LAPSPHEEGAIWVGSDDGRVHITRNGGETWTDVTPPDMPKLGTVNRIEVSPHEAGRAFLAVHRYRLDDWRPYIFRTDDYGEHWRLLTDGSNGIPADYWVRVVREDDVRRGLLYAGTEFGLFVSFDDGSHWQPLQLNLPATPVTDLKVHRGSLAVATQGRSFWVLDDLTPLRELADSPSVEAVRLFTPLDAARGRGESLLYDVDLALPDSLPEGALLSYAVSKEVRGLTLEVRDAEDRLVARWGGEAAGVRDGSGSGRARFLSAEPGFHRVVWPIRYQEDGAVKAPPGEYSVRMRWDGGAEERSFRVVPDPNDPNITQADYEEQFRVTMEVQQTIQELRSALRRLREAREQAREVISTARAADRDVGHLPEILETMEAAFAAREGELTSVGVDTGPVMEGPARGAGLDLEYGALLFYLNSGGGYVAGATEGRPTAGAMEKKRDLDLAWTQARSRVEAALDTQTTAFNAEVSRLGLVGIVIR